MTLSGMKHFSQTFRVFVISSYRASRCCYSGLACVRTQAAQNMSIITGNLKWIVTFPQVIKAPF